MNTNIAVSNPCVFLVLLLHQDRLRKALSNITITVSFSRRLFNSGCELDKSTFSTRRGPCFVFALKSFNLPHRSIFFKHIHLDLIMSLDPEPLLCHGERTFTA
jgi:hypothetical protein